MDAASVFDRIAGGGFLLWVAVAALAATDTVGLVEPRTAALAVLLAVLVLVPLVGRLADLPHRDGSRSRWYRAAAVLLPPAALAVLASLVLPTGARAGALAVPWLLMTVLLAGYGLRRAAPNTDAPAELSVSAGLLYLPVAGVALVAHRLGAGLGFGETTVLLTAVHFHYAGCALPAFAGLLGRAVDGGRRYRAVVVPVVVGPGVVGLGIAFSPVLELVAVTGLALGVAGLALYTLAALPGLDGPGRIPVGLAAVSVLLSMGLLGVYLTTPAVGFTAMLLGHGGLNAVGFGFLGLVGWRLLAPGPTVPPLGLPLSRLGSRGRVGADYLDRYDLHADGNGEAPDGDPTPTGQSARSPRGMVDRFSVFDRPDFKSAGIHPEVRRFYERTADYDLRISPTWSPGFRLGGRLYAWLSRRVEQLNFPVTERDPSRLSSRILPVDDAADGREDVRAWIRTYDRTGAAIYVACYSVHRLDGVPYMNIGFPLPWTNFTSVLSVDRLGVADPDGVELATTTGGDAGIYLRTPFGPLRLPMDETIRVWAAGMEGPEHLGEPAGADLYARHDVFLFGRRFLRLDYRLSRGKPADGTASPEGG